MTTYDDNWSIETPPRIFSPKRQKTEPEIVIKIQYVANQDTPKHMTHVFLLQTIATALNNDVKVINRRGEILKDSVIPALADEKIYTNHYAHNSKQVGSKNNQKELIIIIHRLRGISTISSLKKDHKIMEYLQNHNVRINAHDWKEDEWDFKMLGFLTQVYPSAMSNEYATKIISTQLKLPVKKQKAPHFRIKSFPIKSTSKENNLKTKVFGIEVRTKDAKMMETVLKDNIAPGAFVPFRMKTINEEAYNKAIRYVAGKNENTWTILLKYMSEGAFFKLEQRIKITLATEHVIYDPIRKTVRILVSKHQFHEQRNLLKSNLATWVQELDPDDVKEFNTTPEVSHISRDDYSSTADSYYSHSAETIMTFEVEEIHIRKEEPTKESEATTSTTPSEISLPPAIRTSSNEQEINVLKTQVTKYQQELATYTTKMEKMFTMLESLLSKINENNKDDSKIPKDLNRRQDNSNA